MCNGKFTVETLQLGFLPLQLLFFFFIYRYLCTYLSEIFVECIIQVTLKFPLELYGPLWFLRSCPVASDPDPTLQRNEILCLVWKKQIQIPILKKTPCPAQIWDLNLLIQVWVFRPFLDLDPKLGLATIDCHKMICICKDWSYTEAGTQVFDMEGGGV